MVNTLLGLMATCILSATGLAQTEPAPKEDALREQSIYVPYEKLWRVFEQEGRGVFLPYERFMQLWQDAEQHTRKPSPTEAPVGTLITDVAGMVNIGKDVISVSAKIGIDVLRKGWHEIVIGLGDTALTDATIDDEPARLIRRDDGAYALLLLKESDDEQSLTLHVTFAKSYTKAPVRNSVSFRCPPAPVSRWDVHIANAGVDIDIHPMLATTDVPPEEGEPESTHVLAFVGAAPSIRIEWTPKATGAKGLQALAHVQADHQVSIQEGLMRTRVDLAYEISRAESSQLILDVPKGQKVVNVFDPNIREWSVLNTGDIQRVTALLFEPVKGRQAIVVELEQISNDAVKEVPIVQAVNVSRQRGVVAVRLNQDLRGEPTERSALLQVDAKDLPASLRKTAWDFSYRYAALPVALSIRVDSVQPEIHVESLVESHLKANALELRVKSTFDVRKSRVFDLHMRVPADFEVKSAVGFGGEHGITAADIDTFRLGQESRIR